MMASDEFDIFKKEDDGTHPSTERKPSVILIIDDDSNIRESLETTLKDTFEIILCSSGDEGIQAINSDVDTVILDIKMEGKDGFETYRMIREKNAYVPIIYHSAYQDLKDPYEIMNEFRPFGFISKGEGYAKLISLLNSAVAYHQTIVENQTLLGELKDLNASLEDKVEQRTQEIGEKNELLEETNTALEREILERKKMEEALREAERVKVLAETAGAAAHEINNPLQAVTGTCEILLANMTSDAPYREKIEAIHRSGVIISEIVAKMKDIRQYVTKGYVGDRNIVDFEAASQEKGEEE
ncbi:MAG: response regulator [bacterium]|nr:response regulator [bacterium]